MNLNVAQIRHARSDDHDQILAVHRDAFDGEEGEMIASLVAEMLNDSSAEPIYSFVAEQNNRIVGHVLFTSVQIEPSSEASAQILAPLAVARDQQASGIGSQLVNKALTHLESIGVEFVLVLGYPDYYSRFGFVPAGASGFQAPYPILPKNANAWMVKELKPGAIERYEGTVRCCTALDHAHYWQE